MLRGLYTGKILGAKFSLTCHNGAPVWMFVSLSKERASSPKSRRTFSCQSKFFDEIADLNSVCLVGLSNFKFRFISKKVKIVSEIVDKINSRLNLSASYGGCMIKIYRGVGRGGSSEGCLKWGGGGSLRDLWKNI